MKTKKETKISDSEQPNNEITPDTQIALTPPQQIKTEAEFTPQKPRNWSKVAIQTYVTPDVASALQKLASEASITTAELTRQMIQHCIKKS